MEIKKLEQSFSVCQVEDYSLVNLDAEYCFIGKTDEETSLVCAAGDVPQNVIRRDDGWRGCRMSRRGSSCSRSAPSLRCCTSSSRSRQPVSLCCSANSESIKNLRPWVTDQRTEIFDAPTRRAVGQWPAEGLPEYKERAANIVTRLAGHKNPSPIGEGLCHISRAGCRRGRSRPVSRDAAPLCPRPRGRRRAACRWTSAPSSYAAGD